MIDVKLLDEAIPEAVSEAKRSELAGAASGPEGEATAIPAPSERDQETCC